MGKEEEITISDVKKLVLEPDEVLFVGLSENIPRSDVEHTINSLARIFPDNKIVVYAGSLELAKVKFKEDNNE